MVATINECAPGAIRSWMQAQKEREAIYAEREKAKAEAMVAARVEAQAREDRQWEVRRLSDKYLTMLFAVSRNAWTEEHEELFAELQKAMARFEQRRAP